VISSVADLKLDNTKASPLFLNGGRLYRDDGATIIASTSNSIQIDYDPVYVADVDIWGATVVGADNGNGSAGEILENLPKIISRKSDL